MFIWIYDSVWIKFVEIKKNIRVKTSFWNITLNKIGSGEKEIFMIKLMKLIQMFLANIK